MEPRRKPFRARYIALTWFVVILYCLTCWIALAKCCASAYTCHEPFEPYVIYFSHCERVYDANTLVIFERPARSPVDLVLLIGEFWLETTDPNQTDYRWLGDFGLRDHLRDGTVNWRDFAIIRWLWIRARRGEAVTYS